jgi:hypothetical protein
MTSPHLTPDQIHWLIQSTRLGNHDLQSDVASDPLHAYEEHLASCATCNAVLRTEAEAYMQLASLRSTTLSSRSQTLQCPPYEIWLELAAGVPRNDSKELMEHVIQCDCCSLRLKAADDELHSPLTVKEEEALSELDVSSASWPVRFAPRLAAQCPRPAKNFALDGLRSWISPAGFAFAAAVCALLVVSVHDRRVDRELKQTRSRLLSQAPPQAVLAASTMSPRLAVPVELTPGLTRGEGHIARLSVTSTASVVPITLLTAGDPGGEVLEQLVTADGEHLWMQRARTSAMERSTHRLTIFLPATLLPPNDYQLQLFRVGPSSSQPEATYTFRVTP